MKDLYTLADLRRWEQVQAEAGPLRLAVVGDPVAHSASPPMHNAALAACGLEARYTRLWIRPEELAEALRLLPEKGFTGVNITIPHKAEAMARMDRVDPHAQRIGAVNTVVVEEGGRLAGYNTDGPGLVRAVRAEFGVDLRHLRIMLLGAGGGAGRAVAVQCAVERCERLVLVNRTPERVRALAEELEPFFRGPAVSGPGARLAVLPWEEERLRAELGQVDLVVNCSSLGMKPGEPSPLPSALLSPHLLVLDTIYTAARTPLVQAAEEAGARACNGRAMLLHQGALAFAIWFGREAPLEAMRQALA